MPAGTTTLNTETTSRGQHLSNDAGEQRYSIAYKYSTDDYNNQGAWRVWLGANSLPIDRKFRTLEGAQYYCLYLEAED